VDAKNLASFTEESASVPTARDLQDPRYKRIGTSVYDYFFSGRQKPTAGIGAVEAKPPEAAAAAAAPAAETSAAAAAPPPPPPPPKKPDEESGISKRLTLRIDELKQEREASKSQRRENQLLALMQAGFQAAAGKSSSALTNIAGGGAAGIATLADLEKTRRAEDASLRSESLQLELAKEKMLESARERGEAKNERIATREQSGLRSVTETNTRLLQGYDAELRAIRALAAKSEASQLEKDEYKKQMAEIEAKRKTLFDEEKRLGTALLPANVRKDPLDFPARTVP
jgi:hypothetical protein